jgi:xanthine dehydrogenase accessory factor
MLILIRGGGDLASGIAIRLYRSGLPVVITELSQPLVVRRLVSFAEAVHEGQWTVEDVTGRLIQDPAQMEEVVRAGMIPVLVDPDLSSLQIFQPEVLIDARMRKKPPEAGREQADLVIGLGPGFTAGKDCHAVVETNRGHQLGRVYWEGAAQEDTGIPGEVRGYRQERVLRSPGSGGLENFQEIGDLIERGEKIAAVNGQIVTAPFDGVIRGLLRSGTFVKEGMKIGDLDPRGKSEYAWIVSDKSRCLGGAVLEAILSRPELRSSLWT